MAQLTQGPFIEGSLGSTLMEVLSEYPAVMLVGPRQAGKKTLLLHHLQGKFEYVSLDDLETRRLATSDPRALLAERSNSVIIAKSSTHQTCFPTSS